MIATIETCMPNQGQKVWERKLLKKEGTFFYIKGQKFRFVDKNKSLFFPPHLVLYRLMWSEQESHNKPFNTNCMLTNKNQKTTFYWIYLSSSLTHSCCRPKLSQTGIILLGEWKVMNVSVCYLSSADRDTLLECNREGNFMSRYVNSQMS